jgi:hypothetical protein
LQIPQTLAASLRRSTSADGEQALVAGPAAWDSVGAWRAEAAAEAAAGRRDRGYNTDSAVKCAAISDEYHYKKNVPFHTPEYGRVEVGLHSVLTSAIDEDEWSTKRPGRFTQSTDLSVPFSRRLRV